MCRPQLPAAMLLMLLLLLLLPLRYKRFVQLARKHAPLRLRLSR